MGSHIVSGNVFETRALDELLPNWKELEAPINTPVTDDAFMFFSKDKSLKLPNFLLPPEQVCDDQAPLFLRCRWDPLTDTGGVFGL